MDMEMVPVVINASILTSLDARKTPTHLCSGLRSYKQRNTYSICAVMVILELQGYVLAVILK